MNRMNYRKNAIWYSDFSLKLIKIIFFYILLINFPNFPKSIKKSSLKNLHLIQLEFSTDQFLKEEKSTTAEQIFKVPSKYLFMD